MVAGVGARRRAWTACSTTHARHFLQAVAPHSTSWAASAPPATARFLQAMAEQVAVRTRLFDHALLDATAQGCDQVVLVACGLDARASSRHRPAPRLAARAGSGRLPLAAWLAEGILYAPPPSAADLLLDRITAASAPPQAHSSSTTLRTPNCCAPPARTSPPNSSTCGRAAPPRTWTPGSPGAAGNPT
ncbi:class I SAM-dependent methyltransferase [Nonomuraea sp. NPDC005650]|uniref:class I SAM-dependent methyltransferase n=1 Tax=Nonomuraea sp. NPDC005650 TaxID=3157045 RepID=UPI0033BADD52